MAPRLFVIPAHRKPVAVILRRGPSAWYHVIAWNTAEDSFEHGAWFKGRIYEERCDLSPDGELFVYFALQGSRYGTSYTGAWTAVSRPPWLHALGLWPHGTTYGGGGRFAEDRLLALHANDFRAHPDHPGDGIEVVCGSRPQHASDGAIASADWSGRDHGGHVIYTRGGKLFRRLASGDVELADFTALTPDPKEAPAWAKRPVASSRKPRSRTQPRHLPTIFHIAERAAWRESLTSGSYRAASLDTEGFIHCSTRAQVLSTAKRYFAGRSGLVLLAINGAQLTAMLKNEAPARPRTRTRVAAPEDLYPHVYGPINVHAIVRVTDFEPDAGGRFGWPAAADGLSFPGTALATDLQPRSPTDNLVASSSHIRRFWAAFCKQAGLRVKTPYQAWYFGDSAELAHELVDLVVHGPKRATASLLWAVERDPRLAPIPSAYSVVTEFDGTPRAVVRTTKVEVRAFEAVDAAFAHEEGEGDRSLATWRADHWNYFSRECAVLQREPGAAMPVVLERFELLYTGGRVLRSVGADG